MPQKIYNDAHASVRFTGEALDPFAVTIALQLPPDHMHRKGEPRVKRTRNGDIKVYMKYPTGMWSMSSQPWVKSPRLAVHLEWLLAQLEPKADAIAALRSGGVEVDFFCYSYGRTLDPPALPRAIRERATSLGIEIIIDHYEQLNEDGLSEE